MLLTTAKMTVKQWEPIGALKLMGFLVGLGTLIVVLLKSETGFVVVLDHANLMFHEAGHVFFGLFSARLEIYGGTLGQLLFPVLLTVSFWKKDQPLGVAACLIWLFENGLNIARYVADARALALPLVGGGDHDWNTILDRWGLLRSDLQIASAITTVAWTGIALVAGWVLWRAYATHQQVPAAAPSPSECHLRFPQ